MSEVIGPESASTELAGIESAETYKAAYCRDFALGRELTDVQDSLTAHRDRLLAAMNYGEVKVINERIFAVEQDRLTVVRRYGVTMARLISIGEELPPL